MGENRGRLWAEARYMYELDVRANLPRDLMAAQASRAEEHRDRDDVIEDAVANLPDGARLTMGEVIGRLPDDLRKLTQNRIGTGTEQCRLEVKPRPHRRPADPSLGEVRDIVTPCDTTFYLWTKIYKNPFI